MKKILFLLLLSVAMYGQVPTDATPLENIQITNNKTSTTATKVNVQENDGTINTKPLSELDNYLEFASAINLPVTGEQGKLYLTKDNNRLYRFNGTIYQELTTDISGKEDIANKQNSLAVDGTNTKYPTVTAVNTGLNLKANLASPALTGAPTAPTATAGTNTTQVATTAFVRNADAGNVKLTGNQSFTGIKSSTNTGATNVNGISLTNNGGVSSGVLSVLNTAAGQGLQLTNSGTGQGLFSNNQSSGSGITAINIATGNGIFASNQGSGNNIVSNGLTTSTGFNYVGQNNGTNTFTVNKLGEVAATSFIKSSAPATNILLAGGGDIAQNTAFNKNFGTTAGTVAEGNDSRINNGQTAFGWGNHVNGGYAITTGSNINQASFRTALGLGSNAYTSTAYLPLSGGTLSGALTVIDNVYIGGYGNTNIQFLQNGVAKWIFGYVPAISGYRFSNGITDVLTLYNDGSSKFSSTVTATSYTATSLPVFENNAAASSLAVGQFYRTSIGVLMVKF